MDNKNYITVKLFSLSKGLEIIDKVKIIRIKSKHYNLLIMDDYLPIIGEVDGNIDFETLEDSTHLEAVRGYYIHTNDNFSLIINENG